MAEGNRTELLQGTLDLLILKILARGPLHGYAIAKRIKECSGDLLRVEEGSLYPALHRLAKRGKLEFEFGPSELNRRAKFYRLTSAGQEHLADEQHAWGRISGAIERVLATARVVGVAP